MLLYDKNGELVAELDLEQLRAWSLEGLLRSGMYVLSNDGSRLPVDHIPGLRLGPTHRNRFFLHALALAMLLLSLVVSQGPAVLTTALVRPAAITSMSERLPEGVVGEQGKLAMKYRREFNETQRNMTLASGVIGMALFVGSIVAAIGAALQPDRTGRLLATGLLVCHLGLVWWTATLPTSASISSLGR